MTFLKHTVDTLRYKQTISERSTVVDEVVMAAPAGCHLFGCGWTSITAVDIQHHYR